MVGPGSAAVKAERGDPAVAARSPKP